MIPVLTSAQSKHLDRLCIAHGIDAATLMETASRNAVLSCPLFATPSSILVVCGNGNNGGDGFAMARMLHERHRVVVAAVPQPDAMTSETAANYHRVVSLGIPIIHPDQIGAGHYDVIVDALIGVGGGSELREPLPRWLRALHASTANIVAVDVPTGLDATTGAAHPDAVRAAYTMTMEGIKPGMLSANGRRCCGTIVVCSIGAPEHLASTLTDTFALEQSDIRQLLPHREPGVHKYNLGHVMVLGGSAGMRGAAALASEAALRIGAGLVTLVTDAVHPLLPREVMTATLDQAEDVAHRATVIVAGPGFGRGDDRLRLLADTLNSVPGTPVVLDADGIIAFAHLQRPTHNIVVTPHGGELRRLMTSVGMETAGSDVEEARRVAHALQCIVHYKCIPPTTTDGKSAYLCAVGNAGLATAGSGDVLSGLIGGLIAQGVSPLRSAALGAFLHGKAADALARKGSCETIIAGDLLSEIRYVLAK